MSRVTRTFCKHRNKKHACQKHTSYATVERCVTQELRKAARGVQNPAVVFDIDDTVLINDSSVPGDARPNHSIMGIYKAALAMGMTVFIVTARPESPSNRKWTREQLELVHVYDYKKLFMLPKQESFAATSAFKLRARKEIADMGYTILLNVGDQWTDVVRVNNTKEFDTLADFDSDSYWLFEPVDDTSAWALKLPELS
jgi:predicted secreted acid phosphatase